MDREGAALLQGKTPEELQELHREQQERVKSFKQLQDLAAQYRKLASNGSGLFGLFRKAPNVLPDPDSLARELEELRETIKRDENIMRFLTTKLDKFAVAYAVQRREKIGKTQKAEA